jgi:hypothetical protein
MKFMITTFLAFILIFPFAVAQQMLKGKIYDKQTDSVLVSTTIFNATKKSYALSSHAGDYTIEANDGDKIVFTSVGYLPDTVKVLDYMIDAGYDVTMSLKNSLLRNVTIRSASYKQDSLNQREDYNAFYNRTKNKIIDRSGPQNGVGISVSPIGFFHNRSKDKKMKDNLQYQDEQDFVDYAFSRRYVEKLTNLHSDSLTMFLMVYRPAYQFCRAASSEDMLNYINDKLMIYRQRDDGTKKKKKKKAGV